MAHIEARNLVCVKTALPCAVATLLAAGCMPKTEGLTEIFDEGHSYVEFPGQRVLSGNVTGYAIDAGESGPVALGLRDGRLVIARFEGGGECEAGPAEDFLLSGFYEFNAPDKRPKVPFLETMDADWRGPLRFTDHDCNVSALEPVPGASLPLVSRFTNFPPDSYLVLGENAPPPLEGFRRLLQCWPWDSPGCIEVAMVRQLELARNDFWSLELDAERSAALGETSMRLVLRLGAGWSEIASDVREFTLERSRGDAAFVNPEGLAMMEASGHPTPVQVEADACKLSAPRGLLYSNVFSYRAPCETGPLVVYDLENKERFELAGDADPPALVSPGGDQIAFYQTNVEELPTPAGDNRIAEYVSDSEMPYVTGTLWAERLGSGTPVAGPERALLATVVWLGTRAQVLADYDGTTGRLVTWDVDSGEITEIASGVIDFGYNMVLSDFDGTAAVLRHLHADRTTTVLAEGVPDRGSQPMMNSTCFVGSCFDSKFVANTIHWAVLSDYDGSTGTLLLFSRETNDVTFRGPEVIDHGVPRRGYRLLNEGDALLYSKNYDANTGSGELNARFLPSMDTFRVPGVNRFYEVSYPEPGLLYSVPEGGSAGIWYARLR